MNAPYRPGVTERCWRLAYNALLLPLLRVGVRLVALRSAKVRQTLAGHRGLWRRLEAALAVRDPARPLVWFHVASAGEYLQALPVLERLLADGAQGVLTVTSVSGYRWAAPRVAEQPGLLAVDYLPLDTRGHARRLLGLLRPAVLVYTKYDLWPNLVWAAARAGVPQYLVSATLHGRSWRTRSALARSFYRALYAPLAGIFAVTEADARRFLHAAPGHPGVRVLGDTRFDSVLDRRARVATPPLPPYGAVKGRGTPGGSAGRGPTGGDPDRGSPAGGSPAGGSTEGGSPADTVLVVGSSWPADEARIVPGLLEALARVPHLRVVLVPHEIDPPHLAALERAFAAYPGMRYTALRGARGAVPRWRVLLVDAVGVLSALYAHATLAYVGGAFTTGVHNVMEPAAMGAPPIFGPLHHNSPEALHLVAAGAAFAVTDAADFGRCLSALLDDPQHTREMGARARAYVEARGGAAERACAVIRAALAASPGGGTPAFTADGGAGAAWGRGAE